MIRIEIPLALNLSNIYVESYNCRANYCSMSMTTAAEGQGQKCRGVIKLAFLSCNVKWSEWWAGEERERKKLQLTYHSLVLYRGLLESFPVCVLFRLSPSPAEQPSTTLL